MDYMPEIAARVACLEKCLYGNGSEGIKSTIARMDERLVAMEKSLSLLSNLVLGAAGTLCALVAAALAKVIFK